MIKIAYLGVVVGVIGYVIGLLFMDETASDIGNGAMLTTAVILLFRIRSRVESLAEGSGTGGDAST